MSRSGSASPADLVVAMTGGSGAPYAVRLLRVLCRMGRTIQVSLTPSAAQVLRDEMGLEAALESFDPTPFEDHGPGRVVYHHYHDLSAGIASGSFPTAGMVIVPCSMSTLGAIAGGITTNLITRAADVHLKERRKLILVPRETPLSLIHLQNMVRVTRAGAVVLPAMPGWYHRPRRIEDLIDFVVGRICDQLGIANALAPRWGEELATMIDETQWDSPTDLEATHPELLEGK
jgi:4-hydroxy-3-polyprenylbenzoate decarboxylase